METTWEMAYIFWGTLVVSVIALFVLEWRKTPKQKKEEAAEALFEVEEDRQRRQDVKNNAPAKGCIESVLELGVVSIFLFLAVLFGIMVLISTGM